MKHRPFRAAALAGWLLVLASAGCTGPDPPPSSGPGEAGGGSPAEARVVLVIIDGLRYADGLGHPDRVHVPRMDVLAGEGTLVEPFRCEGPTVTRRAVPAIWSGTWDTPIPFRDPACGNRDNQRTARPTLFEAFRRDRHRPAEDCVYLVGRVPCPWRASLDPAYGPGYWPTYVTDGATDDERWEVGKRILREDAPSLFLLYLPDVDREGHDGDWDGYLAAIRNADRIVGELWELLRELDAYRGRTTLLVTNDHGRHDNRPSEPHGGFASHGDDCNGCRVVQCLLVGPGVRRGHVSTAGGRIADITPTLARVLGVATPWAEGDVLEDAFRPGALPALAPR